MARVRTVVSACIGDNWATRKSRILQFSLQSLDFLCWNIDFEWHDCGRHCDRVLRIRYVKMKEIAMCVYLQVQIAAIGQELSNR